MRPSNVTAGASGLRATCAANTSGIDSGVGSLARSTAALPHQSSRPRSAASSTSMAESRCAASAVIASNTRSKRPITVAISVESKAWVSYSTRNPISAPGRAITDNG